MHMLYLNEVRQAGGRKELHVRAVPDKTERTRCGWRGTVELHDGHFSGRNSNESRHCNDSS